MEWRAGRTHGRPDLHADGNPIWWETTDGAYTVSRDQGPPAVFLAWKRGSPAVAIPGKYRTLAKAQLAAVKWESQVKAQPTL